MFDLPSGTEFNRRIPKQKLYENSAVNAELKRLFTEQIKAIYWKNKIAPTTVNVAAGQTVTEIEIIEITLNQDGIDKRLLQLIGKEIPYHLLFLLVYNEKVQAWIGYKEQGGDNKRTFKTGIYYYTAWQSAEELSLHLDGHNMDAVYEGFIRRIAYERLDAKPGLDLKDAIARGGHQQKLQKEIAALEKKIHREKQFNVQVALNDKLRRLKKELEGLGWMR